MRKGLTEIVFVLDESGSMGSAKSDTIGGFNEFLRNQKKIRGEVKFTFVKFSDYYHVINEGTDLRHVSELNDDNYIPSAMTALLDAVGKTVNKVNKRIKDTPKWDRPEKVLFVVLTDGLENASHEFTERLAVPNLVKKMKDKHGWEFLFMGADIDAWAGGQSVGIYNTVNTSKDDMTRSFKGISNYTAMYRVGATETMTMDNFDLSEDELDQQMEDLQKK